MQVYAGYKQIPGNVLRYTGSPKITWLDYAKYYMPDISDEELDYLLWNETAYPFSELRTTLYKLRSVIRQLIKNKNKHSKR